MTLAEGMLALYFTAGIVISIVLKDYGLLPFHLMLAFGFGFVSYYSFAHSKPTTAKTLNYRWKFRMARS